MSELHPVRAHEDGFIRINARLKSHDEFINKFITADANHTASLECIHEKLDEWKEQTKAIKNLGWSTSLMVK
jgi:hypothetical protein